MIKKIELYDKSRDLTKFFELGHAENILNLESKKRKERRDWVIPENSQIKFLDGKIRNVSGSIGEAKKSRKPKRSTVSGSEEISE